MSERVNGAPMNRRQADSRLSSIVLLEIRAWGRPGWLHDMTHGGTDSNPSRPVALHTACRKGLETICDLSHSRGQGCRLSASQKTAYTETPLLSPKGQRDVVGSRPEVLRMCHPLRVGSCALLLSMVMVTFSVPLFVGGQPVYPSVVVTIHRIQLLDPIEGLFAGQAEWYYFVGYRIPGAIAFSWIGPTFAPAGMDDVTVDNPHSFEVRADTVEIVIELCENDGGGTADDYADVSSDSAEGVDDVNCMTRPSSNWYGGSFHTTYDLVSGTMSGDIVVNELGWWKTSGEFDGSTTGDTNDANVFFALSDNYAAPTANAGPDRSGFTGDTFSFDGSGSTASLGSSIDSYVWDFTGDGTPDLTGGVASWTFNTKGLHVVTLTVRDTVGNSDSDTATVTILNRGPTASFVFSPASPTVEDDIFFVDTSTDSDGTVVQWAWDLGDGTTAAIPNPTHRYSTNGLKTVRLTVTDNDGSSATVSRTVNVVNLEPIASFTYSPATANTVDPVQFTDTSVDRDGSVVTWSWDFGDSSSSSARNPTHTFGSLGTFQVALTVTDDDGGTSSSSQPVQVVNLIPTANFSYSLSGPTAGEVIQFTDGSSDRDGQVVSWRWEFGDGSTSTERNPTHSFQSPGTYSVALTVTDNNGGTRSITRSVVVAPGLLGPSVAGIPLVGIVVIVAAGASAAVLLLLRKRKRRSEKTGGPQSPPEEQ